MYFRVSFKTKHLLQMLVTNLFGKKKVKIGLAIDSGEDLLEVKKMVESGKYKPFVDKVFPMEEVVEAHTYIEQGDKAGSIVLKF